MKFPTTCHKASIKICVLILDFVRQYNYCSFMLISGDSPYILVIVLISFLELSHSIIIVPAQICINF